MSNWQQIRSRLHESGLDLIHQAVRDVGRIRAEQLPEDIADSVIEQFTHRDPDVRADAVRTIGIHWRLPRAAGALESVLNRDEDATVQLAAIGGLAALGFEHGGLKCSVGKILAGVVLDERFADYQRMIAYLELLRLEARIGFEEYLVLDRDLPESLANFDIDNRWVDELSHRNCGDCD